MFYRVLTAVVLAPLVLWAVLTVSTFWFAVIFAVISLLALHEWIKLVKGGRALFLTCGLIMLGLMGVGYFYPDVLYPVAVVGALFWTVQLCLLFKPVANAPQWMQCVTAVSVLYFSWSALVWMHQYPVLGAKVVVGFLLIIWCADTFALFAGKAFGRHKLAPSISPGKTIEGVVGGAIAAVLVALIFAFVFLPFSQTEIMAWSALAFFAALISVVGDLFESRAKRRAGAKDSGRLLPGHGGVLDRVDGLIAAAPFFAAILRWVL